MARLAATTTATALVNVRALINRLFLSYQERCRPDESKLIRAISDEAGIWFGRLEKAAAIPTEPAASSHLSVSIIIDTANMNLP